MHWSLAWSGRIQLDCVCHLTHSEVSVATDWL